MPAKEPSERAEPAAGAERDDIPEAPEVSGAVSKSSPVDREQGSGRTKRKAGASRKRGSSTRRRASSRSRSKTATSNAAARGRSARRVPEVIDIEPEDEGEGEERPDDAGEDDERVVVEVVDPNEVIELEDELEDGFLADEDEDEDEGGDAFGDDDKPDADGDGDGGDEEADADDDGEDVLEDTTVSDAELEVIASEISRKPARARGGSTTALARRDPMAAYMAEVRRHPLLSREEEYELAVRWVEEGDAEAGRKLVTSNLRLVVKIAHEYKRTYHNLLDLVQEGNVGLIKAVQKFDPYRNVKISTYAGWWIRAYILKFILNNWRLVKIGTTQNQRKLFFNLRKQQARLKQAGVDPTPERIARELDVSPAEVIEMDRRMSAPDASLNAPLGGEEDSGRTRMDVIEDTRADPEADVDAAEFKHLLSEKLRRFGATLRGRELEIFRDRLIADEPATLQTLGTRWGVSRERARQLEKRMVLRLRKFLQEELGDAVQIALGHE